MKSKKVFRLTVEDRVKAFRSEWALRELYMQAAGMSEEEMDSHRLEILHRYQLTERELEGTDS